MAAAHWIRTRASSPARHPAPGTSPRRTPWGVRTGRWALAAVALVLASPAAATPQIFSIDPTRSWISIAGSELQIDLGPGAGTIPLVARPQAENVPGVAGATLPDGTSGDGLRTTVEGQLLVDRNPATLSFLTQLTAITPSVSGAWLPGTPGFESLPQAGQLGILLSSSDYAVDVLAAVRGAAFTWFSGELPLVENGPGAFAFDAAQSFRLETGTLDFDSNVGPSGRSFLPPLVGTNSAGNGLLESLGGTLEVLTLPVDVTLALGPELLDGLPITANLRLQGELVATAGQAPVPEPGVALLLGAGLLGLLLRRARIRSSSGLLILGLLAFTLSAACNPPQVGEPGGENLPGEECEGGEDDDLDGYVDCEDLDCQTSAACGFGECDLRDPGGPTDCFIAPELCEDETDLEGDGLVDCDDPECQVLPICRPESTCNDGLDDDGDGQTDCEDPDCAGHSDCGVFGECGSGCTFAPARCADGEDLEGDGLTDCQDPECQVLPFCQETVCDDDVDNEGDGYTDCEDQECQLDPACGAVEGVCDDGLDGDADGQTDCDDSDCFGTPACPELACANGLDDDLDGLIDCVDPDCAGDPACRENACANGLDDEGDGAIDCSDSDCNLDPACLEVCDNAADDDGDGLFDCQDEWCDGDSHCLELCDDDLDDDLDGAVDCDDSSCDFDPACSEVCDDSVDNDGDGAFDCEDPFCAGDSSCQEVCDDALDDDGDGEWDCADDSCRFDPACSPGEVCDDDIDNDGDLRVDLEDPDCVDSPAPIVSMDCSSSFGITAIAGGASDSDPDCDGVAQAGSPGNRTTISIRDVPPAQEVGEGEHEVGIVVSHERDESSFGVGFGDVIFELTYGPGGDRLLVGVRLLELGNGSATTPSAFIDCEGQPAPIDIPVNADAPSEIPADPAGGRCEAFLGYGCNGTDPGQGACEVSFYAVDPSDLCDVDADCEGDGLCGPGGVCQDGEDLDPCDSPFDCDAGAGFSCTFGGVCSDGSEGDPCHVALSDFECGDGLSCDGGLCARDPVAESEPNDAPAQADFLGVVADETRIVFEGGIAPFGDQDWGRLKILEGAPVDLVPTCELSGGGEIELFVLAPDGTADFVAFDACDAEPLLRGLEPGDHLIVIRETGNDETPSYTWSFDFSPTCGNGRADPGEACDDGGASDGDGCSATCQREEGVEVEPNDGRAQAQDVGDLLTGRLTVSGTIVDDDLDSFRFDVGGGPAADGQVQLGISVDTPGSGALTLEDELGRVIATDIACDPCEPFVPPLPSGAYVLTIQEYDDAYGSYVWHLDAGSVCGDGVRAPGESCDDGNTVDGDGCSAACEIETVTESEPNDTPGQATDLGTITSGRRTLSGSGDPGDVDLYRFDFGESAPATGVASYRIEAIRSFVAPSGPPSGTTLRILAGGDELAADEDCGPCDVLIVVTLSDLDHFVQVDGFEDVAEPYLVDLHVSPTCGDGVTVAPETCDDGNALDGDGCSAECRREPFLESEPNDDDASADDVGAVAPGGFLLSGALDPSGDEDRFVLSVGPADLGFCLNSTPPFLSGLLTLVDEAGSPVASPGGFGAPCFLEGVLEPGDYTIPVSGSAETFEYAIDVDLAPVCGDGFLTGGEVCDDGNTASGDGCSNACETEPFLESEPNGDTAQADSLGVVSPGRLLVTGSVDGPGDVDVYAFDLPAGSALRMCLDDVGAGDIGRGIHIETATGDTIASETPTGDCELEALLPADAGYFLLVDALGQSSGDYALDIVLSPVQLFAEVEPNDSTAQPQDLGSPSPGLYGVTGSLAAGDVDAYEILSDGTLQLCLNPTVPLGEATLSVRDAVTNAAIASSSDQTCLVEADLPEPQGYVIRLDGSAATGETAYGISFAVRRP
ncbi:MAG: DUF4215 domain-containing protein [Myxococcota bacterium]